MRSSFQSFPRPRSVAVAILALLMMAGCGVEFISRDQPVETSVAAPMDPGARVESPTRPGSRWNSTLDHEFEDRGPVNLPGQSQTPNPSVIQPGDPTMAPGQSQGRDFDNRNTWLASIRRGGHFEVARSARVSAALRHRFTVDLWVNPADLADQPVLRLGKLSISLTGGRFVATARGLALDGTNALPGVWHHVALEVDGNDLALYVDGVRFLGRSATSTPVGKGAAPMVAVGGRVGNMDWFVGQVDNLRIGTGLRYGSAFIPDRRLMVDGSTVMAFSFDRRLAGDGLVRGVTSPPSLAMLNGDIRLQRGAP